jgi:hypothetical protein
MRRKAEDGIGVTLDELRTAVPLLQRHHVDHRPERFEDEWLVKHCHAELLAYVPKRVQQRGVRRLSKRSQLWFWFAFALGLDAEKHRDAIETGTFMLPTSRSAREVLRDLNLYSNTAAIEKFLAERTESVCVGASDVVSQLKVRSAYGVDIIKMLRSRQFLVPARLFSISELKRKKSRWLKRARCADCIGSKERCDTCNRARLLASGIVPACAGHGLCGCKKNEPIVDDAELAGLWAVQHERKLWRQRRCTAPGHAHSGHRDLFSASAFVLMPIIDHEHGGRVEAHCRSITHAGLPGEFTQHSTLRSADRRRRANVGFSRADVSPTCSVAADPYGDA